MSMKKRVSKARVKVQQEAASESQLDAGLAELHRLLRRPGVTSAVVMIAQHDKTTAGCAGKPLEVLALTAVGVEQIEAVVRKSIQMPAG